MVNIDKPMKKRMRLVSEDKQIARTSLEEDRLKLGREEERRQREIEERLERTGQCTVVQ